MSDQLRRIMDDWRRASEKREITRGLLGKSDDDGTYTVRVSERPGWAYVRLGPEGNLGHSIAFNSSVPYRANLPVKLKRMDDYGNFMIVGIDEFRISQFMGNSSDTFNAAPHSHRLGSGLEYEIEMERLSAGRVRPWSGLTIHITPFRYQKSDGTWDTWLGGTIDLTSFKPASTGNWSWVLVGVNPNDNSAVAVAGTEYSYATPLTIDLIDDIVFSGKIPCGAIKIRNDDTELTDWRDYEEAHFWFGSGGSNSGLPWFNVKSYGATGDGTTDDTTAIQDTIDAAETAGGGVVFFPAGIYVVGGALQDTGRANAQLLLPSIDRAVDDAITIELRGEYPPFAHPTLGSTVDTPTSGSIVKGTLNAGGGGALFGCQAPAAASTDFSRLTAKFMNLGVQMPANPVLSGLNLGLVTGIELDNIFIYADTYNVPSVTEPTTATSYGIILPKNNNGAWTFLERINVLGFYNGIEVNEHAAGDNIHVWVCKNAFVFEQGNHASHFSRLMVVWCETGIKFQTGAHYTEIEQYDIEHYHETPTKWFDPIYDIDDTSDYGNGVGYWHVVLAGSGPDITSFTKNGGRKFATPRLGGNGIAARVYYDASFSLLNATATAHPFNNEKYDSNTIHDNSTNNTRLTCQTAGLYHIQGIVRFAANSTGQRQLQIRLNGTTVIAQTNQDANSSGATHVDINTDYQLTPGDYVELLAYQTSTGSLNSEVHVSGESAPVFSMKWIGN